MSNPDPILKASAKCFFVRDAMRDKVYLRRYANRNDWVSNCPSDRKDPKTIPCDPAHTYSGEGYHSAMVFFEIHQSEQIARDEHKISHCITCNDNEAAIKPPPTDIRWPQKCEYCGYIFDQYDAYQLFHDSVYIDDTGREYSLKDPVPGMMWDSWWMPSSLKQPDSMYLNVVLPDGWQWSIDSQASNCTRKGQPHQCWCRHGVPPLITVDKNGNTCSAGAGSIISNKTGWHGFLRNGILVPC